MEAKLADLKKQEVVRLNVGGKIFVTTKQTLCKEPSLLALLAAESDPENILIDRSPDLFKEILQYLRTGTFPSTGMGSKELELLVGEAEYYELNGMKFMLQLLQEQLKTVGAKTADRRSRLFGADQPTNANGTTPVATSANLSVRDDATKRANRFTVAALANTTPAASNTATPPVSPRHPSSDGGAALAALQQQKAARAQKIKENEEKLKQYAAQLSGRMQTSYAYWSSASTASAPGKLRLAIPVDEIGEDDMNTEPNSPAGKGKPASLAIKSFSAGNTPGGSPTVPRSSTSSPSSSTDSKISLSQLLTSSASLKAQKLKENEEKITQFCMQMAINPSQSPSERRARLIKENEEKLRVYSQMLTDRLNNTTKLKLANPVDSIGEDDKI